MITFGDYILYGMCDGEYNGEKTIKHTNPDIVAGKMWLIGRSYAASPERRIGKKPDISKETTNTDTDFFGKVADLIVCDERRNELDTAISQFQKCKYSYDFKEDKHILEKTLDLVELFNEIIKSASMQYKSEKYKNATELPPVENNISFVSKYLHFHLPEIIYIMDNYSRDNGKKKYNKENKQILNDFKRKSIYGEYSEHILRCYFIAQELNADNKDCTPRVIDNILMLRG